MRSIRKEEREATCGVFLLLGLSVIMGGIFSSLLQSAQSTLSSREVILTLMECPVAFIFLHHLLMSYLYNIFLCKVCSFSHHSLGCEKDVSTLMASWTTDLLCSKSKSRLTSFVLRLPCWQYYQDFSL